MMKSAERYVIVLVSVTTLLRLTGLVVAEDASAADAMVDRT